MATCILDFGHSDWKFLDTARPAHPDAVPHALVKISENQWKTRAVDRRGVPLDGFACVDAGDGNGWQYFAYGESARGFLSAPQPRGASRYVPEYFGVGASIMIARSLGTTKRLQSVDLWASHAPRDIVYTEDMVGAVSRQWRVVTHAGESVFTVRSVSTFDEPLGGFFNFMLTQEGKANKDRMRSYGTKTLLMIDIGGVTTDVVAIDPGGNIDVSSFISHNIGVIDTLTAFERDVRDSLPDVFKRVQDIRADRLFQALHTGDFPNSNGTISVKAQSDYALNRLTNDVLQVIEASGAGINYDFAILTGGGGALIGDRLQASKIMQFEYALSADKREQVGQLRYANAWGGHKLAMLEARQGVAK